MNYISVCSGIEAATVAWNKLGWNPLGFSEVDKFPSAVLQHHYPNVPNLGDMTNYKEWNINESVDLIIGGTPCQSFSISGLRKGLEDPRGNLALTYIGLLDHFKPKYFIWENVPGVLSSNKGEDFSSFIRAVQEIRYGFAYRVLDAQYFGVPQRRKRVFVVGCSSGDWRSAAEILFESESLSRDTEESRQKGKDSTKETRGSSTTDNRWPARISNTLDVAYHDKLGLEDQHINADCPKFVPTVYESHPNDSRVTDMGETCTTVTARWGTGGNNTPLVKVGDITEEVKVRKHKVDIDNLQQLLRTCKSNSKKTNKQIAEELSIPVTKVEHWFRTDSSFAIPSDDVWFDLKKCLDIKDDTFDDQIMEFEYKDGVFESSQRVYDSTGKAPTLTATNDKQLIHHKEPILGGQHPNAAVGDGVAPTLTNAMGSGGGHIPLVAPKSVIRRLTPVECERLQGFPCGYTEIPYNNRPHTPDGHRYKALGNSMAVPVIRWLGERINGIDARSKVRYVGSANASRQKFATTMGTNLGEKKNGTST
jgi:DNA (cytosine-5)-methyltransferase 1